MKVRSFTSGPDALVMRNASWTLMLWSFEDAVTTGVLQQLADGINNLPFALTIEPTTIEPSATGSVAELLDYEGPANLSGWLSIGPDGYALFCESLTTEGACHGAQVNIDWETGKATPPAGLLTKGDHKVSDHPITLAGVLKARTFSVGL